jgi:antitoxin YefM
VAKTVPVREFRTRLSELLSEVADRRDHVLVTRNGKPAAALVPIDEYEALDETAEILSDSATLAAIEAGLAELARDETVTLTSLRAELGGQATPLDRLGLCRGAAELAPWMAVTACALSISCGLSL